MHSKRCIVLCVSCWLSCAGASSNTSINEATRCHGNTLLQLATKPTKILTGRDHSTVAAPHTTASLSTGRATWNMAIFAVILALGIFILCAILNLQTSSRRAGPTVQGATFGNQFGSNPGAALLAKHADGQSRTRAQRTPGTGGSASSSARSLCPGLVVPANSDCVLVIRIMPKIVDSETDMGDAAAGKPLASTRAALELDVFDLLGKSVLSASIAQQWPKQGDMVVTLRPLGAPRASDSGYLTQCRAGSIEKSISIYGKDDTLFGHMKRDPSSTGYVLNSSRGELLFLFEGSFEDHRIRVFDRRHTLMAHTEPCKMAFEPEGQFYQTRIATGVDVGLVLSGLLAIQTME